MLTVFYWDGMGGLRLDQSSSGYEQMLGYHKHDSKNIKFMEFLG